MQVLLKEICFKWWHTSYEATLIAAHEISESSPRQQLVLKRQRTIEEAVISGQNNPQKRRLINTDNSKCITLGLWYTVVLI